MSKISTAKIVTRQQGQKLPKIPTLKGEDILVSKIETSKIRGKLPVLPSIV